MKSLYFALILLPGIHSARINAIPNLSPSQIILCSDAQSGRHLKIEVLDADRQIARLIYSAGGAPIVNRDAAYARSDAGFDFAVVTGGRPTFTALLDPDQRFAHVPRNGAVIPCGEAF